MVVPRCGNRRFGLCVWPGGIRVCVLTARFVSRLLGVVSARKEKRLEAAQAIAEQSEPQNFVTAARAKKWLIEDMESSCGARSRYWLKSLTRINVD